RVIGSLLVIISLTSLMFADTIRLKDGSILKGKIVSFDNGKFVISIGEGSRKRQLTFMSTEIASIEFDSPTAPPQSAPVTTRTASYDEPAPKPTKAVTPDTSARKSPPSAGPAGSGSKMQPVVWQVKVLADNTSNGWTNSGWVVKKGQRIRISGDGKISLGKGQSTTPSGESRLEDPQKLLKNVPTGALIAVIGDDNNDFIYVGAEREFTASRDGALFLGINEGNLNDNSGAFNVKIEILPD
ncbi:MAG TPA: LecA/PA-IL family lectin, partial [Pyrinomonadaceae bacterium]|nr:LecA/PA-IL family lectin [Pyrinomonadaceae bacterium]